MAATTWTPHDDATLAALHAQDLSVREIAERMGKGKSTIQRRAHLAGLAFDRARTQAATHAVIIDAKARRAALELALLDDAERLRTQIWEPHEYIDHGGKDFTEVRWTQNEPSPTDKLKLMQAVGLAVDRSVKIAVHDADAGTSEAVGMLDAIAAAIAGAVGDTEPP